MNFFMFYQTVKYDAFIVKPSLFTKKKMENNRFFISYSHGKWGIQPVGINRSRTGQLLKEIAELLGLKKPGLFTGHCHRKSATLIAKSAANFLKIKEHGDGIRTLLPLTICW